MRLPEVWNSCCGSGSWGGRRLSRPACEVAATGWGCFSYVTLATLGYGDVIPVTDGARSLAVLESLCGTIYMAILVARLIGLHLSQTGSPR